MQQPDVLPHKGLAPTPEPGPVGARHLRVVTADEEPPTPLVAYVVLAPGHLPPEELFSPLVDVDVRPVTGPGTDPAVSTQPLAGRPEARRGEGVRIDREARVAHVDGRRLDLTYLEFELLAHLVANPQRVHSRSRLLQHIWGYDYAGDGRTVDVHIARLRRKLGPSHRGTVLTVRRVGYKYVPHTADAQRPAYARADASRE